MLSEKNGQIQMSGDSIDDSLVGSLKTADFIFICIFHFPFLFLSRMMLYHNT